MASKWLKKFSGWIKGFVKPPKPARKKASRAAKKSNRKKKNHPRKTPGSGRALPFPGVGRGSKIKKLKIKKPALAKKIKSKRKAAAKKSIKKKLHPKKTPGNGRSLPLPGVGVVSKKPVALKLPGIFVGKIAHYFPKAGACAIKIEKAELKEGASIRIHGKSTDFKMTVKSIQINRIPVPSGRPGEDVGIGVSKAVEAGDSVYLV